MRVARYGLMMLAALVLGGAPGANAAEAPPPISRSWPHDGMFGTFDRAALQRGLMVYEQVCAACHGLRFIHFRNLTQIGLSEDEARAIAATYQIEDGPDDFGDMFMREGQLQDRFPDPFPNEQAARMANNGAYPPDLSLMTKAREGGPDYFYSFLVGYGEPPADVEVPPGMHYNRFYPGNLVAMPEVLFEGAIDFPDGTDATVSQMAADLTQFLHWAAEPTLEERKQTGLKTILFLLAFTGIFYAYKRKVWSRVH